MSKEQLTIFWGKVSESARERNLNSFISDFEKKFPGFKDNMCVMKLEKMLKKIDILKSKNLEHIYSEYKILSIISHPFIVEFKGLINNDPKHIYYILEYIQGGELFTILRTSVTDRKSVV